MVSAVRGALAAGQGHSPPRQRSRLAGHYSKPASSPAHAHSPARPSASSKTAAPPARCTTSSTAIHPDEALLAELRQRQQTPDGRAKLRERVAVEHALAHVGHWQGRRARYLGTRKNLFDLSRVAVVHNLHIIVRQSVTDGYQLAA